MTAAEVLAALAPVTEALAALGVRHFVGGSLASSVHGVPRASLDADVAAELRPEHVPELLERLAGAYYLEEGRMRDAIDRRQPFNLVHLATMLKVDLFVSKGRPHDARAFDRARPVRLEEEPAAREYPVASAEDVVLAKLEWFRAGGEVSERQWADVVGVLRTAASGIDRDYLRRWARSLGVEDLLQRALEEAS